MQQTKCIDELLAGVPCACGLTLLTSIRPDAADGHCSHVVFPRIPTQSQPIRAWIAGPLRFTSEMSEVPLPKREQLKIDTVLDRYFPYSLTK